MSALDVALNDLVGRLVGDVAAMVRTTAMAALASAVGGEREIHRRVAAKLESRLRRDANLTAVRLARGARLRRRMGFESHLRRDAKLTAVRLAKRSARAAPDRVAPAARCES